MSGFLAQVAQAIVDEHDDLRKLVIVLPSRRAAVFLKEELSQVIEKAVWSPQITTSEDFVLAGINWQLADQPSLIFKLYEAYSAELKESSEDFAEFSRWAQLLLADFNEIDRYLVAPKEIFRYLSAIKEVNHWY